MPAHSYHIEQIRHFICGKCRQQWSITGWHGGMTATCPKCGHRAPAKPKNASNDKSTEKTPEGRQ